MTQLTRTYRNGVTRTFDVISVEATDDPMSVILVTEGDGQVLVCRRDTEELWQQMIALGLVAE